MSESHQYLTYFIHISDVVLIADLQSRLHPSDGPNIVGSGLGAILAAPDQAAITYSAPIKKPGEVPTPPCITSEWFRPGTGFNQPYPTNVATFDQKSGGWFGISWLFGDTTHFHWRGVFIYAPPAAVPNGDVLSVPSARRWIDGFELPTLGEGATGSNDGIARIASRHPQGYGLALRNDSRIRTHSTTENGGTAKIQSWERFYVRLVQAPAAQTTFWRAKSNISPAEGCALVMTPSGQIGICMVDSVGTLSLVGTTAALALHTWVKLDILTGWGNSSGLPNLVLFFNGVEKFTTTDALAPMRGAGRLHVSSEIGGTVANTLGLDVDDWINADIPNRYPGTPPDWRKVPDFWNGSAVLPVSVTGDHANRAGFVGDWRIALQLPGELGTSQLTNAAAGRLELTSDAHLVISELPDALGVIAITTGMYATGIDVGSTLGFSNTDLTATPGSTAELKAITQAGSNWMWSTWTNNAITKLTNPLSLVYVAAGASIVYALGAVAEVIGVFGEEDVTIDVGSPSVAPLPPHFGIHNAPYPRTPWARETTPPLQPVFMRSGTYTGNGTGQDLLFPVPIHWIWIRPLTGDAGGTKWWSSLIGAHKQLEQQETPTLLVQACMDPNFEGAPADAAYEGFPAPIPPAPATTAEAVDLANRLAYGYAKHTEAYWAGLGYLTDPAYFFVRMLGYLAGGADIAVYGPYATVPSRWNTNQSQAILRLAGANTQSNAAGVVYAYVALGDPGMRFMQNDGLTHHKGAADQITTLVHPSFAPLAGFFLIEAVGGGSTAGVYYKGPGHAPSSLSPLGAAELANALAFTAAAQLTSKSALHTVVGAGAQQIAFSLFRTDDGGGHAGKVVQITSYVGDGAGSRTVALLPASGKRPVFALVVRHDNPSFQRDASHTGTTSTQLPNTANAATGITGGGVDTITVGSICNANGVGYDVFAIPGDSAGGNGGFSVLGDFYPVPPEPPPDAPGRGGDGPEPPNAPVADPAAGGGGVGGGTLSDPLPPFGPMPTITDDLAVACEPDTRRAINLALSKLGISKQVGNVTTDLIPEAVAARLVYDDAIQQTLRDFAWPFATRYVQLAVLNGGARPNSDWLYAYRQPVDCIFERRIVVSRQDAADPAAIPFACSSDDTGGMIFTNLANAVLEYTARPKCPHTRGEPLFREAAAWKLAELMSPALTRMTDGAIACAKAYAETLVKAQLVIRPGNPGELPAAATVDTSAAAAAANVAVVNLALIRIGARVIRNLTTDQSREAQVARIVFEQELRATLRDFPWSFATAYVTPAVVGGTAAVPVNGDWQYSYRLPTDVVFIRRLVDQDRRAYGRNPPTFRAALDATGGLIYTDQASTTSTPVVIEYTRRPEGAVLVSDALFKDALAWRLAWTMAPSLAQVVPEKPEAMGRGPEDGAIPKERPATDKQLRSRAADQARQCYYFALSTAKTAAANEGEPDLNNPDADWIAGR